MLRKVASTAVVVGGMVFSSAVCLLLPVLARAEPRTAVVVGKADATQDVPAVQSAVDGGGTVRLVGIFDFGPSGRVLIRNDVKIYGETTEDGLPRTTVLGGHWSFFSPLPLPTTAASVAPGPEIDISGIRFVGAKGTPIHIAYTRGLHLSGNHISGLTTVAFGAIARRKAGVIVGLRDALSAVRPVHGAITGPVVIEKNEIDMTDPEPAMTQGLGIFANLAWGADLRIQHNNIANCSRLCLDVFDNYLDEKGNGSVIIERNVLKTADVAWPFPGTAITGFGIGTGWSFDLTGTRDRTRDPPIRLEKNDIWVNAMPPAGQSCGGIFARSDGIVITQNTIVVGQGNRRLPALGVTLLGSSHSVVEKNTIEGPGDAALTTAAVPAADLPGNNNQFIDNKLVNFVASQADVVLRTDNNMVVGKFEKVIDTGIRNVFPGKDKD